MVDGGGIRRSRIKPQAQRAPANKYYRGNASANSPFERKVIKPSLRSKLTKFFDWLLVIVVIFCFIYSLIVKPDPKVIASSHTYRPTQVYQDAAAKQMKSFKDKTKLSFDETSLIKNLQSQFPEISSTKVELPIVGQRPIVHLTIAQPKFLYKSGGQTFVLASNGVLVAKASALPSTAQLSLIDDQSGYSAALGKAAISATEVSFISQVVAQYQQAKVPIKSLVLPAAAQELDVKTTDKNYFVKFYLGGDALVQTGQFLAARHQFALNHQDPATYLDVRVSGKVFFK